MSEKKSRKCIAVFLSSPEKDYQAGVLRGIYKAAFENDVNVAVFETNLPRSSDEYHEGEMNIYRLVNYDLIAGAIYLPDTNSYEQKDELITKPLMQAVEEKGLPAVTIDYEIEGLPCYYCDDTDVVSEMVKHMTDVHGCRDIAYMTGIKGHPHSELRLSIFRSIMSERGLEVSEDRVYYGDFWFNEGDNFVKQLLESEKGLPEAIVCASGPMTASVYHALYERGIHVPSDVRLGGYDESVGRNSFISSTVRNTEKVGYAAGAGLIDIINGKDSGQKRHYVKCDFDTNYSLTCGCTDSDGCDLTLVADSMADLRGGYFTEFNTYVETLLSRSSYEDMLWAVDWFTYFLDDCKGLYFCMCDDWDNPDTINQRRFTSELTLDYYRYFDENNVKQNGICTGRKFSVKEMFPLLTKAEGKPAAYVLRALHFEDRCFGFAVITYDNELKVPPLAYNSWINDLSNALESQRRLLNIQYLYRKMRENAVTDMMTGLLNRNGFNVMLPQLLNDARQNGCQTLLVMGDLNGLKYINDTFGHNDGDESIKIAAGALARTWIGGAVTEKNFRIGGDEFVKAAYGHFRPEQLSEFKSALNSFLDTYNATSGKPYPVYISLGFCLCEADDVMTADKMLSAADKEMYEDKKRVKRETGFDPKRA